jgi:hypothetical protein
MAVPCVLSMSVYRVPSAVFTSVTGLFTFRVSVCEPLEYEPPTIATVAVVAVSERSWKSPFAAAFGFAVGKVAPLATVSGVLFTEITADVGAGAGGVGGAGGTFGGVVVPEPVEPPEPAPEPVVPLEPVVPVPVLPPAPDAEPFANGSFDSKRENDSSWPVSAVGFTAEMRPDVSVGAAATGAAASGEPASVGAAVGVATAGVTTGVVVAAATGAATGFVPPPPFSAIIVCTAYAIASTRNTDSPMTIFFCFAAFAFAASAGFFRATFRSSRAD